MLQGLELRGEDITVLAGCGAVLDLVIYCIASDGDSIGIPAPYYPAFDNDVKVRRTRTCSISCGPAT